jgi:hypothetical protein
VSDLRYEFQLALANRAVGGVETVFIMAGDQYALTSSSLIRQVVALGGDIRQLKAVLPDIVVDRLREKHGRHKLPKPQPGRAGHLNAAPPAPPGGPTAVTLGTCSGVTRPVRFQEWESPRSVCSSGPACLLAAAVGLLARGRGAAGRTGAAIVCGLIVLLLAGLNVYQLASGLVAPALGAPPRARPAFAELAPSPTTTPFITTAQDQEIVDRFARLFYDTEGTCPTAPGSASAACRTPTTRDAPGAHHGAQARPHHRGGHRLGRRRAALGHAAAGGQPRRQGHHDRHRGPHRRGAEKPLWKERVEFILGSSTDPAIVAKLAERAKGKKVMVILDSDHRQSHVAQELEAYASMVNVGGYLIVQDTSVERAPGEPGHGPGADGGAGRVFGEGRPYVVDRTREALLFTLHPRGYLKRVK